MKSLIIEGPDGAGKTRLSTDLLNYYLRLGYKHLGQRFDLDATNFFLWHTEEILAAAKEPTLLDRSFHSERVYGKVMRNGNDRLGDLCFSNLSQLQNLCDIPVIYCLPPWEVVRENWLEKRKEKWNPETRKGDYVDAEEKARSIHAEYTKLSLQDVGRHFVYDYTGTNAFTLLKGFLEA